MSALSMMLMTCTHYYVKVTYNTLFETKKSTQEGAVSMHPGTSCLQSVALLSCRLDRVQTCCDAG